MQHLKEELWRVRWGGKPEARFSASVMPPRVGPFTREVPFRTQWCEVHFPHTSKSSSGSKFAGIRMKTSFSNSKARSAVNDVVGDTFLCFLCFFSGFSLSFSHLSLSALSLCSPDLRGLYSPFQDPVLNLTGLLLPSSPLTVPSLATSISLSFRSAAATDVSSFKQSACSDLLTARERSCMATETAEALSIPLPSIWSSSSTDKLTRFPNRVSLLCRRSIMDWCPEGVFGEPEALSSSCESCCCCCCCCRCLICLRWSWGLVRGLRPSLSRTALSILALILATSSGAAQPYITHHISLCHLAILNSTVLLISLPEIWWHDHNRKMTELSAGFWRCTQCSCIAMALQLKWKPGLSCSQNVDQSWCWSTLQVNTSLWVFPLPGVRFLLYWDTVLPETWVSGPVCHTLLAWLLWGHCVLYLHSQVVWSTQPTATQAQCQHTWEGWPVATALQDTDNPAEVSL